MTEKKERRKSIQERYRSYYMRYIIIPIFAVFGSTVIVILYFSQREIETRVDLVQKQIEDSLNKETYDNAIQMSQLLVANDNQFVEDLGQYFRNEGTIKYEYREKLDEQYNQVILSKSPLIGIQMYSDEGETYNYKSAMEISYEDLKETEFYEQAHDNEDRVEIVITDRETMYTDIMSNGDSCMMSMIMAPTKSDITDEVDLIMMNVTSQALESIRSANQWAEDVSIYLYDNQREVLQASDDIHLDEVQAYIMDRDHSINGLLLKESEISRTGWRLVVVAPNTQISSTYRTILTVAFLILVVVFSLFYWFITRLLEDIINPINKLSKTMKKVERQEVFEKVKSEGPEEIVAIGNTYNEMIEKIQQLMDENIEKEREKQKEEIQALEAQINPHFLSNTVNAIQFVAKMAKFTNIEKMAESMNRILALTFRNKNNMQTLDNELNILEAYIYIMKIRYVNGFDVRFQIEDGCEKYNVPKLMLQPFIENAIIHGFSDKDDQGEVIVSVKREGDKLLFQIYDNGKGMSQETIIEVLNRKPQNGNKIAIANIHKRLKMYYGNDYSVQIKSEIGKYTEIYFYIPVIVEEKLYVEDNGSR